MEEMLVKPRIAMATAVFDKKRDHVTSKMDLEFRKEPVKCHI
jgi:hypothetical protein